MTLDELNKVEHSKSRCPLKDSATQPVFGDGNKNADIVFIGEAPGKDEDLKGFPFIGRSGKFLDKMLAEIKMKRSDVYITNTVKYRPPNNRDPKQEEKTDCLNWLIEELKIIKPKIIIPLGNHAMQTFFPKGKIGEMHGKLLHKKINFEIEEKTIPMPNEYYFPLYHPAAALYNGGLQKTLLKDFKKIPLILKEIEQ